MIWQTKVVQIESARVQWDESEEALEIIKDFVGSPDLMHYSPRSLMKLRLWNKLENQWLNVPVGHWVVRGLKDELYPCDPEAMDGKYFEFQQGDEVSLVDLIRGLQSVGESLSGSYYIKESDMVDMGEYLQAIADRLEKFGVK